MSEKEKSIEAIKNAESFILIVVNGEDIRVLSNDKMSTLEKLGALQFADALIKKNECSLND